jgi:hypothetical protein
MAGYSRVKPPQSPPDNNDDLSSLYSRPSIQNSPHWPSVNLHSPGPSVRTLNQSDGGTYRDDISSLANFSSKDIDPSDRGSVFTANMSASPSSSRPSTPSGSFRGQYQPCQCRWKSRENREGVEALRNHLLRSVQTSAHINLGCLPSCSRRANRLLDQLCFKTTVPTVVSRYSLTMLTRTYPANLC